jgi:hypothetical protein
MPAGVDRSVGSTVIEKGSGVATPSSWEYQWLQLSVSGFFSPNVESIPGDFADELASLGRDRWELAGLVPVVEGGFTKAVVFFFKRPRDSS